MTPEETALMEAADRLRRLKVDSRDYIYFWIGNPIEGIHADRATLADAFLSLWPAEPEPVAIDAVVGENWILHRANRQVMTAKFPNQQSARGWNENRELIGESCYPTESAARLALRWQRLREVRAMGEKA